MAGGRHWLLPEARADALRRLHRRLAACVKTWAGRAEGVDILDRCCARRQAALAALRAAGAPTGGQAAVAVDEMTAALRRDLGGLRERVAPLAAEAAALRDAVERQRQLALDAQEEERAGAKERERRRGELEAARRDERVAEEAWRTTKKRADEAAAGAKAAADEALTYGEGNSVEAALAAEAEGQRAREDELKALLAEQQRRRAWWWRRERRRKAQIAASREQPARGCRAWRGRRRRARAVGRWHSEGAIIP